MAIKKMTSREYLNQLSILHGALLLAQILFAGVASYLVVYGDFGQDQELLNVLQIAVPAVALAGYLGSIFIFRVLIKGITQKSTLSEKLNAYRSALIIRLALLEAPTMFSLVAFLLTGNFIFVGYPTLLIVLFIMNRPSASRVASDLELNAADKNLLENPNSLVTEINLTE